MATMRAFLLENTGSVRPDGVPLVLRQVGRPAAAAGEVLLRVLACGVCHTELDEIEGRTLPPNLPVIPGHQVVGVVEGLGEGVTLHRLGARVGVGWIHSACGRCAHCRRGLENLCREFQATGRDRHGGYAEYMTVSEKSAYPLPENLAAAEAAPLLCGGAIGYRSLQLTGLEDGETLGLMGFGASAHIVLKLVRAMLPESPVMVFARGEEQQRFALSLGANWAGGVAEIPPVAPRAIIDTTPAWGPVLAALEVLSPGGRLVINAIRKEPHDHFLLQDLSYERHLWLEKEIKSVANITSSDIRTFLELAGKYDIRPKVTVYPFLQANRALTDLKHGSGSGAKVLVMAAGEQA